MIQLTLTEDQAQLVGMACEFYARIRMGQFGEIPFRCAFNHCPKDPEATKQAWLELRKQIYPDLCGAGHSYGMGKFDDADRAFDVYQVIRYAMGGQPPFSYHELPKCEMVAENGNRKRLIDAGDLWSDIMMLPHNGDMISSEEVEQTIKEAETVAAVEVVRCKDCIHRVKRSFAKCTGRKPDDFCSDGAKRLHE